MSAICGVYYLNKKPMTTEIIQRMTDAMAHRGIDGSQIWFDGSLGLGHQMMHTTPESVNENLPFATKESRFVITSDSRIDNREELYSVLSIRSVKRQFMPDSHVILYAYNKWGGDCVNYLQGDFVFAIWDSKEQRLFCASDPMGSRTLKVYQSDDVFAFATEAKSILTLPEVQMKLNEQKLVASMLINLRHKYHDQTIFNKIYNLPAATSIVVMPHKVTRFNYWKPQLGVLDSKSDDEYIKKFRELLFNSIINRMRSEFPVAILLSGGLDSSTITYTASRTTRHHYKPFFVVSSVLKDEYQADKSDNRYFIKMIEEQEKIRIAYVTPETNEIYANLDQLFFHLEDPMVSPKHYMFSKLYQTASANDSRVILDGCGGEMGPSFEGYGYLAELAQSWHLIQVGKEICRKTKLENRKFWDILLKEILMILFPNYFKLPQPSPRMKNSVINLQFLKKLGLSEHFMYSDSNEGIRILPNRRRNLLRMIQAGLSATEPLSGIPGNATVLHPFRDKKLLEFCLSIPGHLFNNGEWTRFLIRTAMEEILPEEIQWQKTKVKSAPDYYNHLKQNWQYAWDVANSVKTGDPVQEYIDVNLLKKTLEYYKNKPSWAPDNGHDPAKFIIQTGVHLIKYLEWFKNFKPAEKVHTRIKTVTVKESAPESRKVEPVKPKVEQKP